MKILNINTTNKTNQTTQKHKPINFKGQPYKIYNNEVKSGYDAIKVWFNLQRACHLDVHSDKLHPEYKQIRLENYSFLDKLTHSVDKLDFIERYCSLTDFPNLKKISKNINNEIQSCFLAAERRFGPAYKVLNYGYDPTCSLGLEKAFPGSDMDKGFVILEGTEYESENTEIVNQFKGHIWNNLNQSLVSLNHHNTFPSVYTRDQILEKLNYYDDYAERTFEADSRDMRLSIGQEFAELFVGLQFSLTGGGFPNTRRKYPYPPSMKELDPVKAAKFNIDMAKELPKEMREEVKNFAFFAEIFKANFLHKQCMDDDDLFLRLFESKFVRYSNLTQVYAWMDKIKNGYMKSKLRNRMQLEQDFPKMTVDDKYDLIKDVIKYSSDDQCDKRFEHFFKNDDDINDRYKPLLDAIL